MQDIKNTHMNIGCGEDLEILELANIIKGIVDFIGKIIWDKSKPDGTYQKLLDVSKLTKLGWEKRKPLKHGIISTYNKYHY